MLDLILFLLIITLTTIFIFVVAPILSKTLNKDDIEKIQSIIKNVILFIEQTKQGFSNEEKKTMAVNYAKTILEYMELHISDELLDVIIEAQVYLLKK
ncbi:Bacteriophage holin of superfamily 6 (Holin_LLH) [Anaerovirgula multivorans]|uniref:Bacteriophage holin of superfamily 6 (Holin_LLH) n=1 Tax=Anaerovirgula multivorans TaxID=312168 RepID=A0A239DMM2_9FIRM|nr:phage holin, LLH family [Anaerovirgula multivorans]SNS32933.1 Bacteriophage holin of superfamily 6 (Holin_LLH) [Anaerovirgula multivorans]